MIGRAPAATPVAAGDGRLPDPGRYELDPVHTIVGFVARHLVVTRVRGHFLSFSGTVTVAEPIERSHVEVEIRADSIATGIAARDTHLRSPDFFDAVAHPVIAYRSTALAARPDGGWDLDGDLTIRGTTRPVRLDVTFVGARTEPDGERSLTFRAATRVRREDWGLVWDEVGPTGGLLVGHEIDVELLVHAVAARP